MADSKSYDLIVVGAGPGGYVAAIRAAQLGMATAIVERDKELGGTCLLRGCIPTKALLHAADLFEEASHADDFGIRMENLSVDWAGVMKYKEKIIKKMAKGVEFLMKKNKVDVLKGTGRLSKRGEVEVVANGGASDKHKTKNIIIATGSAPRSLPGIVPDGKRILTSDHILEMTQIPKTLLILGAGAIGVEFASVFQRFGTKCTILELLPAILPIEDEDISKELTRVLRKQGIECHTGAKVESVTATAASVKAKAKMADGTNKEFEAEYLLVAVGRGPVTEPLGISGIDVQLNRGFVQVNRNLATAEPGIYAIGDVLALPDNQPHAQLAHLASAEGIAVVEAIAGGEPAHINYNQVVGATYCSPEVASVGLTEKRAKEAGYDVKIGTFPFSAIGKAAILGETAGLVKIVGEKKYDEILGVHIVGPKATELIAEASLALRLESTGEELVKTIHAHPTLSEAIHEAAHALEGAAIHM